MTADEAIAIVRARGKGRTRYEGHEPFLDEILVAEIMRLREHLAVMSRSCDPMIARNPSVE
jgi:hypothetical protein